MDRPKERRNQLIIKMCLTIQFQGFQQQLNTKMEQLAIAQLQWQEKAGRLLTTHIQNLRKWLVLKGHQVNRTNRINTMQYSTDFNNINDMD